MFGIGEMIGGAFNFLGGERANAANARMAADQRHSVENMFGLSQEFMERMSNTAHQRATADMRQAGLNPLLSVTKGPASSPSSAPGSPALGHPRINTGESFNSGRQAAAMIGNIKEDTVKKTQEGYQASAKTELDKQQTNLVLEQQETQKALTRQAEAQASILSSNAKGAQLEGEIDETKYGALMRYINRAIRSITGGASAYRDATK